jgi:hypothetical protein
MGAQTALLLFSGSTAATLTAGQLFVGNLVFTLASTVISSALMPKPDFSSAGSNLQTTIDPIGAADIVYGEIRKGGTKTYHETTGDGKFYHYFLTLAMHEVEEIGDIYINDKVATIDADGFVTSQDWSSKILIKKFTGASNQNIYSSLGSLNNKPENWTSTFKGQGVACLYVRLEYDSDVFQSGMPLITSVVKGKKVYDPRKDSTSSAYNSSLGVSTHRTATSSTWQYSDNPALVMRDYLTSNQGVNALQDQIDDDMVATAANDCANTGIVGAEENSFSIDGSVNTGKTKISNLNSIIQTFNGTLFWAQGKFRMLAGAYHEPTISNAFTLDDVRSSISIQTRHSRRDLVNTVRGTFNDKDNRWIATEFSQVQLADMSEDNNIESVLDLQLPLVTKSAAAQRLAKQILYTSREQITLTAKFSARAYQLQVGDTIKLTMDRYGWTDKIFMVKAWKSSSADGSPLEIEMTLQETSSTAYQWSVSADEYNAITSNNTSLDDIYAGLAISTLNLSSGTAVIQGDGTALNSLAVSWAAPANGQVTSYEIGYKTSGATNYQTSITDETTFLIEPAIVGQQYNVRVRAITSRGNKLGSYKSATSAVIGGDTIAPSTPNYSNFTAVGGYQQVILNWVNPSDADLRYVEIARVVSGVTTVIGNSSGTTFVDSDRDHETTYTYKIRAVDFSGNASSYTSTKSATTIAEVSGPNGFTTAQVFIYAAGATAPSNPSGTFDYTYSTGVLSGGTLGSWSTSIPALSTGQYLWVKTASAYSNTTTDSIPASEFSAAVKTSFSGEDGANGNNSATVSLFKKTSSTSVPDKPTTSETYTFSSGSLTATDNGWTQGAPTLTSGEYLWSITAVAYGNGSTDTIAANEWSTPVVIGIAGGTGDRGAGQWIINLASANMPAITATSSAINTLFTADVSTPVQYDQAWFTDETTLEQRVWIYDGTNWNHQTQVIDGNLLVDGTITADMIRAGTLDASLVTIENLTIEDTLRLEAGGAGFLGGRTSQSSYGENGFFLARTDLGGGSLGYENSVTSTFNDAGTNRISGFIAKNNQQLKVFNPLFLTGGSTSGGTNSVTPNDLNNWDNIGLNDEVTVTVYGGGGAGGFGLDDGGSSGRNNSGGTTTVRLRRGSTTGTILATITASGGQGGLNANGHGYLTGGAGQATDFGNGGAGGSANNDGSNAGSSWGAGGGGAGGDDSGWFDSGGLAGGGGSAGQVVSQTIDLSAETVDTYFVVETFGAGGVSTGGTYQGGTGGQGAASYTSILGGTTQYTVDDIVTGTIITGPYSQGGTGGFDGGLTSVANILVSKTNDYNLIRYEGASYSYSYGDQSVTAQKVRAVWRVS